MALPVQMAQKVQNRHQLVLHAFLEKQEELETVASAFRLEEEGEKMEAVLRHLVLLEAAWILEVLHSSFVAASFVGILGLAEFALSELPYTIADTVIRNTIWSFHDASILDYYHYIERKIGQVGG